MLPEVSIIIKAYNEEKFISMCIESALVAIQGISGEIILADSLSTDNTVKIASDYPITIVQLNNADERCCGAGPQLGYQFSKGEFIYILDADMELDTDFLHKALERLKNDCSLAGVGGIVTEKSEANFQFRNRKRRNYEGTAGLVKWLDMGGLYRRSAIDGVGYFSNRNLHAFEEQELGLRLISKGWKLERMDCPSVNHYGYEIGTFSMIIKRWESKYINGSGEILRSSIGKRYFLPVVMHQKHLLFSVAVWIWSLISLVFLPVSPIPLLLLCGVLLSIVLLRYARNRNIIDSITGIVIWQISALGLLRGLLARQIDPAVPLATHVVKENKLDSFRHMG